MTTPTTVFVTVANNSTANEFIDSAFRYTLFPIFYGLVFALGLIANCYALYVLHHMRESKAMNEIRIYMTNLTVADLLFVSVLPFWIGYYTNNGDWKYSDPLCRVAGTFFFINTYGSILFLTVISISRYWAVTRPLVAASSDCWKRGAIVSAFIWIVTLAAAVKYLTQPGIQEDKGISRCFEGYQTRMTLINTQWLSPTSSLLACSFLFSWWWLSVTFWLLELFWNNPSVSLEPAQERVPVVPSAELWGCCVLS